MKRRTEKDSLGEKQVPADAYYGIQTQRAVENYPISGYRAHPKLIRAKLEVYLEDRRPPASRADAASGGGA